MEKGTSLPRSVFTSCNRTPAAKQRVKVFTSGTVRMREVFFFGLALEEQIEMILIAQYRYIERTI
jgi:hypothetical protein